MGTASLGAPLQHLLQGCDEDVGQGWESHLTLNRDRIHFQAHGAVCGIQLLAGY